MVNEEHYARLKESVQGWNEWRLKNQGIIPDLSKTKLWGLNLSGANLIGANLLDANLSGANLSGANLFGANLFGANLFEVNLLKANLGEANLSYATFCDANLSDADLSRANIKGTDFTAAELSAANFRGVNFSRAYLYGAKLRAVNLKGFNLSGANLFRANLFRANLIGANLSGANLEEANLSEANLRRVNLSRANLLWVNLSGLDLREVDLREANLSKTQALGTDFTGAKFTGACLEDWNINSATKLNDIDCQYIYLKSNEQERRPSSRDFAPGEFSKVIQKALNTVDLFFTDGIDWKAFLLAFQELQDQYGEENLSVQAIEKKSVGAFIIRLEVPKEANKADIEIKIKALEARYHAELKVKDEQIADYRQWNASLHNTINLLASQSINNTVNVIANAESKSMSESYQSKYDQRNSNNQFVDTAQSGSNPTFNQYNYTPEQKKTLAEAASEIQKLLNQLEETNPTATEAEKVAYVNDETTPSFKRRVVGAFQAGGETAIDEFILENKYLKVAKAAIKGWLQPGS